MALATVFYVGKSPIAPGTFGSAAGMLLAPFCFLPLTMGMRCLALLGIFILGSMAAGRVERSLQSKDPGQVVVDELLGQWLAYLPFVTLSWWGLLLGFVLFRVFDILKPAPVRHSETWLPGGWGIMIDDVVAGVYAALLLFLAKSFWPGL